MLLSDILPSYLQARAVEGLAKTTVDWYGWLLRRYARWLTLHESEAVWSDTETIERYMLHCHSTLKPNSVFGTYTTLRVFCAWLIKRKTLNGLANPYYKQPSPMDEIRLRRPSRAKPRTAELEDYDRLNESIMANGVTTWVDFRDLLAVRILYLGGLRANEAVRLEARDFHLPLEVIVVRQGKGGDDRPVPLLPALAEAFVNYIYVRPQVELSQLLISSYSNGGPRDDAFTTSGLRQMLERRCAQAGIAYLNPHAFRHGLAMHLLNAGGDMSLVQKVLGHSQISTTATFYAKWLVNPMVKKFTEIMGNNWG